jgi:hypothetical protein
MIPKMANVNTKFHKYSAANLNFEMGKRQKNRRIGWGQYKEKERRLKDEGFLWNAVLCHGVIDSRCLSSDASS